MKSIIGDILETTMWVAVGAVYALIAPNAENRLGFGVAMVVVFCACALVKFGMFVGSRGQRKDGDK